MAKEDGPERKWDWWSEPGPAWAPLTPAMRYDAGDARVWTWPGGMAVRGKGWVSEPWHSAMSGMVQQLPMCNLTVRWWAVSGLLAVLPVLWLAGWERRRMRPGMCRVCGYDLRATPDRCPECGAVPETGTG